MRMARKCCVRSCEADVQDARARGLPLHKFPKDVTLRNKWLTSGGFETTFKPSPGQVICHKHFKRADYEAAKGHKFVLRKGSVPSVFTDYDNHPGVYHLLFIAYCHFFVTKYCQIREFYTLKILVYICSLLMFFLFNSHYHSHYKLVLFIFKFLPLFNI